MAEPLVGKDPAFRASVELARRAAEGRITALLIGPTGSGKSHLGRWMARRGPDGPAPYLEWSAAAAPGSMLEAELLGIEGGVATGVEPRPGILEAAGASVLCLQHLERLSLHQQASLLRALEERSVTRLGGREPRPISAHLLASFQDPPEALVARGLLREDLLYRLDLLRVDLPPLASRGGDVPRLFDHFLGRACSASGTPVPRPSEGLAGALADHRWPGNLWELSRVAEHLARSGSDPLTEEDLPPSFWLRGDPLAEAEARRLTLSELKDAYIRSVLARVGGNRTQASRWLGISRKALWEHLKRGG